jgi:hypothetical protein
MIRWTRGSLEVTGVNCRLSSGPKRGPSFTLRSTGWLSSGRVNYDRIGLNIWSVVPLAPEALPRAQELYLRVWTTGGTGSSYIQEGLLHAIAMTADVQSVPFWLQLLDLVRPREARIEVRRTTAVAALAFLAIKRNAPAAYEALRQAARHDNPAVRALAVRYLGRAYLDAKRPISPEALDDLAEIAVCDSACGPRFQARAILRTVGAPVPMDYPGGVFAFKVSFSHTKIMSRTIELKSEQTLDDLHFAIQRAIDWDADHLYSFFMNGKRRDERYRFSCPFEDADPPSTDEAIIGELGLVKGHTFLYYFDYGDSHEFDVQVVDIQPKAKPGQYPRVVDKKGKSPAQYRSADEEMW